MHRGESGVLEPAGVITMDELAQAGKLPASSLIDPLLRWKINPLALAVSVPKATAEDEAPSCDGKIDATDQSVFADRLEVACDD